MKCSLAQRIVTVLVHLFHRPHAAHFTQLRCFGPELQKNPDRGQIKMPIISLPLPDQNSVRFEVCQSTSLFNKGGYQPRWLWPSVFTAMPLAQSRYRSPFSDISQQPSPRSKPFQRAHRSASQLSQLRNPWLFRSSKNPVCHASY